MSNLKCSVAAHLFLLLLFVSNLSQAQRRPRFSVKESGSGLKLKLESRRAPEFKDSKRGVGGLGYWGVINLEFELDNRKDEWLDELEVYCLVLAMPRGGGGVKLEETFRYMDLRGGEKNNLVLFITPNFFRRHMDSNRPDMSKLSVYVELRVNGSPLHRNPIVNTATGIPRDWFQKVGNAMKVSNALLLKSKTPFADLDYDYYLYEVPGQ
ncbi:MAG: hypothetical protein PHG44_02670 [Lentisphaeria bacterium]|nr:hypothetical protein [Lentisphaeria bacterium]NLZ59775.1 hypothetical protein [Lentisphaerota bacterium]